MNQYTFLCFNSIWIIEAWARLIYLRGEGLSVQRIYYLGSVIILSKIALPFLSYRGKATCSRIIILRTWKFSFLNNHSLLLSISKSFSFIDIDHIMTHLIKCSLKFFFLFRNEESCWSRERYLRTCISQPICWFKSIDFIGIEFLFSLNIKNLLQLWIILNLKQPSNMILLL